MENKNRIPKVELPQGVIFNAYPDSIGQKLVDTADMLKRPEFEDLFSLFYILPTIFNSDLDRGFSVIDYDLNDELVSQKDLDDLKKLKIEFKFDLVMNHLSVNSPQFLDLLKQGDESEYKNFFIDWNEFWESAGQLGPAGHIIPNEEHLNKLFMRKPGLPILKLRFPDGTERPYWNTFYQEINYPEFTANNFLKEFGTKKLNKAEAEQLAISVNSQLHIKANVREITFEGFEHLKEEIIAFIESNRRYLGQMDLNAKSQLVWDFYDDTLQKLKAYGAKLIRLDAFAYLHKEAGKTNFFNKPGTWEYLDELKRTANKYDLTLLPEIHSQYGTGLHEEVSAQGFPIYDFFLPGLAIHAIERGTGKYLLAWLNEIIENDIKTVNMLGCHDGIPVLDLNGIENSKGIKGGLLSKEELEFVIDTILERGGRVKNLYGPDGKKIAYYQVNATFYSALGENDQKLLMARALQLFMPGTPQVWYLDLFAGKNDYEAADNAGTAGHKEINRTSLTIDDIEEALNKNVVRDQLRMIRLRNTSPAFNGQLTVNDTDEHLLHLTWKNDNCTAGLEADLQNCSFTIKLTENGEEKTVISTKITNQYEISIEK